MVEMFNHTYLYVSLKLHKQISLTKKKKLLHKLIQPIYKANRRIKNVDSKSYTFQKNKTQKN